MEYGQYFYLTTIWLLANSGCIQCRAIIGDPIVKVVHPEVDERQPNVEDPKNHEVASLLAEIPVSGDVFYSSALTDSGRTANAVMDGVLDKYSSTRHGITSMTTSGLSDIKGFVSTQPVTRKLEGNSVVTMSRLSGSDKIGQEQVKTVVSSSQQPSPQIVGVQTGTYQPVVSQMLEVPTSWMKQVYLSSARPIVNYKQPQFSFNAVGQPYPPHIIYQNFPGSVSTDPVGEYYLLRNSGLPLANQPGSNGYFGNYNNNYQLGPDGTMRIYNPQIISDPDRFYSYQQPFPNNFGSTSSWPQFVGAQSPWDYYNLFSAQQALYDTSYRNFPYVNAIHAQPSASTDAVPISGITVSIGGADLAKKVIINLVSLSPTQPTVSPQQNAVPIRKKSPPELGQSTKPIETTFTAVEVNTAPEIPPVVKINTSQEGIGAANSNPTSEAPSNDLQNSLTHSVVVTQSKIPESMVHSSDDQQENAVSKTGALVSQSVVIDAVENTNADKVLQTEFQSTIGSAGMTGDVGEISSAPVDIQLLPLVDSEPMNFQAKGEQTVTSETIPSKLQDSLIISEQNFLAISSQSGQFEVPTAEVGSRKTETLMSTSESDPCQNSEAVMELNDKTTQVSPVHEASGLHLTSVNLDDTKSADKTDKSNASQGGTVVDESSTENPTAVISQQEQPDGTNPTVISEAEMSRLPPQQASSPSAVKHNSDKALPTENSSSPPVIPLTTSDAPSVVTGGENNVANVAVPTPEKAEPNGGINDEKKESADSKQVVLMPWNFVGNSHAGKRKPQSPFHEYLTLV